MNRLATGGATVRVRQQGLLGKYLPTPNGKGTQAAIGIGCVTAVPDITTTIRCKYGLLCRRAARTNVA